MGATHEDTAIAVIGMGCRFPQAESIEEFWRNLLANRDCITPVPPERFDITPYYSPGPAAPGRTTSRHGGFLRSPFAFDAGFFRISPNEAAGMDPQHRLLLPVVREALEGAGLPAGELTGTATGVYIGQATADYARTGEIRDVREHTLREATGSYFRAMAAGRVSFDLDLRGPSMTIDTACSSSLVAVHAARQSLLAGESDLAIAGGVNIILSPLDAIAYSQAAMLSPDGRCKFGDSSADGFVRSEGIGVVVLARLADARRAGHRVLALLPGSAVTNDGRSSGSLIKPAVSGQTEMIQRAWREAAVTAGQLDYIEAHGTGTPVGDTVELQALAAAAAGRRPQDGPLRTGSVKSNIGHTEAAAGIAGLIKAVLIAQHGTVPASLHLHDPQPLLADDAGPLRIVTGNEPLRPTTGTARIGVNSFGLSGTNAHVVVTTAPHHPAPPPHGRTELPAGRPTHLLVLSARSPGALRNLALRYAGFLAPAGAGHHLPLWDICATAALHRDTHPHRLWATGADHQELCDALTDLAHDRPTHAAGTGTGSYTGAKRTVFTFPGQGSQWAGMARALPTARPAVTTALHHCDTAVQTETGWSPRDVLDHPGPDFPHDIATVQPVLWATQTALAAAWQDMGVDPDICLGHSMGEIAAATTAGALTIPDAAAVICRRSTLMQQTAGHGAMMSVELSAQQAQELTAQEKDLCIAAENAPTATVLAGDQAALQRISDRLEHQRIFHRPLRVTVASHSPFMDPLRNDLLTTLADLHPRPATTPLYSTVHDRYTQGTELTAEYWMDNLRRPVRFLDAVRHLTKEADCAFIEISPHPLLLTAIQDTVREAGGNSTTTASTTRHHPHQPLALARALGAFHSTGGTVDWQRWYGTGPTHRVHLPTYPWDTTELRRTPTAPPTRHTDIPTRLDNATVHLHGRTPIPPAVHLAALNEAATQPTTTHTGPTDHTAPGTKATAIVIEDARLEGTPDEAPDDGALILRVRTETTPDGTLEATVHTLAPDGHPRHGKGLTARVRTTPTPHDNHTHQTLNAALRRCTTYSTPAQFLTTLTTRGYNPAPGLRTLRHLWHRDGEAVAQISRPTTHPHTAYEACLLTLLAAIPTTQPTHHAYTVTSFTTVRFLHPLTPELWVHTTLETQQPHHTAQATVHITNPHGQLLATFEGITLHPHPHNHPHPPTTHTTPNTTHTTNKNSGNSNGGVGGTDTSSASSGNTGGTGGASSASSASGNINGTGSIGVGNISTTGSTGNISGTDGTGSINGGVGGTGGASGNISTTGSIGNINGTGSIGGTGNLSSLLDGLLHWSAARLDDTIHLPRSILTRLTDTLTTTPQPTTTPAGTTDTAAHAPAAQPEPAGAARTTPAAIPRQPDGTHRHPPAQEMFLTQTGQLLGMPPAHLDVRRSLQDYGLDSLLAAQLRDRLLREADIDVSLGRLLGSGSLQTLIAELPD